MSLPSTPAADKPRSLLVLLEPGRMLAAEHLTQIRALARSPTTSVRFLALDEVELVVAETVSDPDAVLVVGAPPKRQRSAMLDELHRRGIPVLALSDRLEAVESNGLAWLFERDPKATPEELHLVSPGQASSRIAPVYFDTASSAGPKIQDRKLDVLLCGAAASETSEAIGNAIQELETGCAARGLAVESVAEGLTPDSVELLDRARNAKAIVLLHSLARNARSLRIHAQVAAACGCQSTLVLAQDTWPGLWKPGQHVLSLGPDGSFSSWSELADPFALKTLAEAASAHLAAGWLAPQALARHVDEVLDTLLDPKITRHPTPLGLTLEALLAKSWAEEREERARVSERLQEVRERRSELRTLLNEVRQRRKEQVERLQQQVRTENARRKELQEQGADLRQQLAHRDDRISDLVARLRASWREPENE